MLYKCKMEYKTCNWFLYFSVISVNLFYITTGFTLAWNSPVIPKLVSNSTDTNPVGHPVTILQVSILTSLFPLGGIVGTVAVGKFPDIFGRKKTLTAVVLMTAISYTSVAFGRHIYFLFVFITSVAIFTTATGVVIPIYISEVAEDRNRGKLGCLMSVGVGFGQFLCYSIGPLVSFKVFGLVCALPAFVVTILSVFISESPVFLASKRNKMEGFEALKKLRINKNHDQIELEYMERQDFLKNQNSDNKIDFKDIFKTKYGRRCFFISLGVRLLQKSSGIYSVISFLAPLLNEVGSTLPGETLAAFVALGKIVAAIIAFNLIDKLGRRFLILFASFTCGSSLFILGFYFFFKTNNFDIPQGVNVVPIACILTFVFVFSVGLSSPPFIVASELLPNEFRAVGCSIIDLIGNTCLAALCFSYPIVAEYWGVHYCMFAFSFFNFFGFVFTFLTLPETKGKSFSEIRALLS